MNHRQIWQTPKAGNIKNLKLEEAALKPLPSNQIRIKTKAVGLNFADIFALTGLYSATPEGIFIPGLEFSGVVQDCGEEVKDGFKPGDKVMGCIRFGAYASVIDVSPDFVVRLPEDWSFEQGAAFPAQSLTAWYALKTLGDIQPKQNVLIQSAAGGVGLQAMKMCQALNATPIGTVRSEDKKTFLKGLGFDEVIVRGDDFKDTLTQQLNGRPLNLVLDAVGGQLQKDCYELLAPMGRMVIFGAATFAHQQNRPNPLKLLYHYLKRPLYDPLKMMSDNKSVMAFNLIWLWQEKTMMQKLLQEIQALPITPPHVGHRFDFAEAHQAINCLYSGKSIGKVVLLNS